MLGLPLPDSQVQTLPLLPPQSTGWTRDTYGMRQVQQLTTDYPGEKTHKFQEKMKAVKIYIFTLHIKKFSSYKTNIQVIASTWK